MFLVAESAVQSLEDTQRIVQEGADALLEKGETTFKRIMDLNI